MGILNTFYPDEYLDSAYDIDYAHFLAEGKRGVIFDIDNTLVTHGDPADERAIELVASLHQIGMKVLVLSNNKEPRVKSFAEAVGCEYIFKGNKPLKGGYLKAAEMMELKKEEVLYVGDQIFTDVWGAKRVGMYSILTRPIDSREEIQIVLKRHLEKIVLYFFEKDRKK